jgi:hypothetical protein
LGLAITKVIGEDFRENPMKFIRNVLCMIFCALLITAPRMARATGPYLKQAEVTEADGKIRIMANSPRPLEQALDALYLKYKWDINYEDPQYISKLDLAAADPSDQKTVPAGGPFSVEFPAGMDKSKVLQLVLDAYNASDNPGRFELRNLEPRNNDPNASFVVGAQAHNLRGQLSRRHVPFDLLITLPTQKRKASETLKLICQQVSAREHVKITMGVSPRNLLDNTTVEVGGARLSARNLLWQTLEATHRHLYWRLLFDPSTQGYFFDVHLIPS